MKKVRYLLIFILIMFLPISISSAKEDSNQGITYTINRQSGRRKMGEKRKALIEIDLTNSNSIGTQIFKVVTIGCGLLSFMYFMSGGRRRSRRERMIDEIEKMTYEDFLNIKDVKDFDYHKEAYQSRFNEVTRNKSAEEIKKDIKKSTIFKDFFENKYIEKDSEESYDDFFKH